MLKFKQLVVSSTQFSSTLYGLDETGRVFVRGRYWEHKETGKKYRFVPSKDHLNYYLKSEWVDAEKEHIFYDSLIQNFEDLPREKNAS